MENKTLGTIIENRDPIPFWELGRTSFYDPKNPSEIYRITGVGTYPLAALSKLKGYQKSAESGEVVYFEWKLEEITQRSHYVLVEEPEKTAENA